MILFFFFKISRNFQETFKAQEKEITGIKTDSQVLKKQINQMAELMEFVQSQQKPH